MGEQEEGRNGLQKRKEGKEGWRDRGKGRAKISARKEKWNGELERRERRTDDSSEMKGGKTGRKGSFEGG